MSLHTIPADQRTTQLEERLMNVGPPLIADLEAPVAGQPRQSPLHNPSMPAQPFARFDPAPGDAWDDSPLPKRLAAARVVVALVGMQLHSDACAGARRVCGSAARRPLPPPAPWSRGRWPRCGSSRGVRPSGRPRGVAWSPSYTCPSGSARCFAPRGRHGRRVERGSLPVDLVGLGEAVEYGLVQPLPHAGLVPLSSRR